jgi:putative peptide zinc metalloprotease protein
VTAQAATAFMGPAGRRPATGPMPMPALREDLQLHDGPKLADGSPSWTIYDPLRNAYFRLGWLEVAMLTRWGRTAEDTVAAVQRETAARIDTSDVAALAAFLRGNQLTQARSEGEIRYLMGRYEAKRPSAFTWLLHHYLFVRVPLLRPDRLLDAAYPWIAFVFTRWFALLLASGALVGIVEISRAWDEYRAQFQDFISLEGLACYGAAIVLAKIIHELGHAFTCRHYGVRVPTMGVALLVMMPVLYTDAGGAARLTKRLPRLHIGAAGMLAEVSLAVLASLVWVAAPPGILKSAAFLLSSTTLAATLLVNVSPFMRFDGYYLLGDLLGIDNLQPRSFALARWWLRRTFLGLDDPMPDPQLRDRQSLLVIYAIATWIYRLILFLGIAFLVYQFFIKIIGIFLMFVELGWFIARPIYREVATLVSRRQDLNWTPRAIASAAGLLALALLAFVPWNGSRHAYAMLHAKNFRSLYAPAPARLVEVLVKRGDWVKAGQPVAILDSPELAHDQATAELRAVSLAQVVARSAGDQNRAEAARVTNEEAGQAQAERLAASAERQRLTLTAPIDGAVTDLIDDTHPGRWVDRKTRIAEIVDPTVLTVEAYLPADDASELSLGAGGTFYPKSPEFGSVALRLAAIDHSSVPALREPALASRFGGPIPVQESSGGALVPTRPLYRAVFEAQAPAAESLKFALAGAVEVDGPNRSLAGGLIRHGWAVVLRESGF